jgi:hypothetical protein
LALGQEEPNAKCCGRVQVDKHVTIKLKQKNLKLPKKYGKAELGKAVAELYGKLDSLRAAHGKTVSVALGQRPVFGYHADLETSKADAKIAAEIFPEIAEAGEQDFFDSSTTRHHPFFQLYHVYDGRGRRLVELRLLPGETYKIYTESNYEEAVMERGELEEYLPLTQEQAEKFMSAYGITEGREKFLALVGK